MKRICPPCRPTTTSPLWARAAGVRVDRRWRFTCGRCHGIPGRGKAVFRDRTALAIPLQGAQEGSILLLARQVHPEGKPSYGEAEEGTGADHRPLETGGHR